MYVSGDGAGADQAAEVTDRMEARANAVDFISSFQTHPGRAEKSAAEARRVKSPRPTIAGGGTKAEPGCARPVPGVKL